MTLLSTKRRIVFQSDIPTQEIFQNVQIYSLRGFPIFNKMNTAIEDISDKFSSLDGGLYILKCLDGTRNLHTYRILVNDSEDLVKVA